MSIAINPVTYTASVNSITARSPNPYATYEQLLALQAENDLLETGQSATTTGANDNVLLSSDLLSLSPAALNILNGINATTGITGTAIAASVSGATALSTAQQQQAAAIVAQYANAPATAQTFGQIETALTAAGINPEQVSIEQLFNFYAYAYLPGLPAGEQLASGVLESDLLNA